MFRPNFEPCYSYYVMYTEPDALTALRWTCLSWNYWPTLMKLLAPDEIPLFYLCRGEWQLCSCQSMGLKSVVQVKKEDFWSQRTMMRVKTVACRRDRLRKPQLSCKQQAPPWSRVKSPSFPDQCKHWEPEKAAQLLEPTSWKCVSNSVELEKKKNSSSSSALGSHFFVLKSW